MRLSVFAVLVLGCVGCSQKRIPQLQYQLKRVDRQPYLIPPAVKEQTGKDIVIRLPKYKRTRKAGCDLKGDSVRLSWQGRTAELRIDRGDAGDNTRIPLSILDDVNRLRVLLRECLKDTHAARFMNQLLEQTPLPPSVAYVFRYGGSANAGYIDIDAPFRMKVVVPVRNDAARVHGFETAWYQLRPRFGGEGYRLVPERAEVSVLGKTEPLAKPQRTQLQLPPSSNYYRLFFLTRRSPQDHDILVLAARTSESVGEATVKIKAEGESACAALASKGLTCMKVPLDSAISAELRVMVNGKPAYVPLNGTVNDALRFTGQRKPEELRDRLRIVRPYGKLKIPVITEPGSNDVLGLVLIGEEEIFWQ